MAGAIVQAAMRTADAALLERAKRRSNPGSGFQLTDILHCLPHRHGEGGHFVPAFNADSNTVFYQFYERLA